VTATNLIRADVRLRVVRMLADKILPGDEVGQGTAFYQVPTSAQPRNCIFFGDIDGPVEVANLTAGRINRDDAFDLEFFIMGTAPAAMTAAGDATEAAVPAVERAVALYRVLEDLIADHPKLDGEVTGLQSITVRNNLDGPNPRFIGNQWTAVFEGQLHCTARLS